MMLPTDALTLVVTAAHAPRKPCAYWSLINSGWSGPNYACVQCATTRSAISTWRLLTDEEVAGITLFHYCMYCNAEFDR